MIALELSSDFVRGLRTTAGGRFVEIPVEAGAEAAALREALRELGGNDEIRIVLRNVPSLTTLIVNVPPEEIGSISQHVPLVTRDMAWQALPLFGGRTLLMAGSRVAIEQALDKWGVTIGSGSRVAAVGSSTAAIIALATSMPEDADLLYCEGQRGILVVRKGGEIVDVRQAESAGRPVWRTGPDAERVSTSTVGGRILRPESLPLTATLVHGATLWNTPAFPLLPDIEPAERRRDRALIANARRIKTRSYGAAVAALLMSAGLYLPMRVMEYRARNAQEAMALKAENSRMTLLQQGVALATRRPAVSGRRAAMERILEEVVLLAPTLGLTEIRVDEASSPYPALAAPDAGAAGASVRLSGRAVDLEAVERLREKLGESGFDASVGEAGRTGAADLPIRFQLVVQ